MAASTGAASALAPNSITSVNVLRNPLTTTIRLARPARISPSSSGSASGTISVTAAMAACNSVRGTTASISAHRSSSPTGSILLVASNRTSTAAASLAEARASLGCWRTFSFAASRSAFPTSSVTINRSNSSKQSSIALASRYATVASSVARRRGAGCRRNCGALAAAIP